MTSRRPWVLVAVGALLLAGSCSGSGGSDPIDDARRTDREPSSTASNAPPATTDPALAGLDGLIATTGRAGLQLVDPATGNITMELAPEGPVTQPTWSRDGSRLVALAFDAIASPRLLVVDVESATSRDAPVTRPYFFFSWSPDGTQIAALGPGADGNESPVTTLDILDRDGRVLADAVLAGNGLYVAWEPGGRSLLAHRDDSLILLDDPTDPASAELIGTPGNRFQAASWIPGSRRAVYIAETSAGASEVVQVDVDTFETVDLGPANGFVNLTVSPDGQRLALAHTPTGGAASDPTTVAFAPVEPAQGDDGTQPVSAPLEVLELRTRQRTPLSDVPGLWIEWSPSGDALVSLLADLTWLAWSDGASRTVARATPTEVFFRNYVVFSGQYVETPRLWSPDGTAITYPATTDHGSRFFVLPVGEPDPNAVDLGSGQVAFWSPAATGR